MDVSERDPLEDAYQRGLEHGAMDERERAIKAGVFREGSYVEPPPTRGVASVAETGPHDPAEFHESWATHWRERTEHWMRRAGELEEERNELRQQLRGAVSGALDEPTEVGKSADVPTRRGSELERGEELERVKADLHQVHLNYHHMVDEAQRLRGILSQAAHDIGEEGYSKWSSYLHCAIHGALDDNQAGGRPNG